jgi:hypothetical protein
MCELEKMNGKAKTQMEEVENVSNVVDYSTVVWSNIGDIESVESKRNKVIAQYINKPLNIVVAQKTPIEKIFRFNKNGTGKVQSVLNEIFSTCTKAVVRFGGCEAVVIESKRLSVDASPKEINDVAYLMSCGVMALYNNVRKANNDGTLKSGCVSVEVNEGKKTAKVVMDTFAIDYSVLE